MKFKKLRKTVSQNTRIILLVSNKKEISEEMIYRTIDSVPTEYDEYKVDKIFVDSFMNRVNVLPLAPRLSIVIHEK